MVEEDELPEGEMVELEDDAVDVEDTEDGGAIVTLDEEDTPAGESDFYANLAETMPDADLNRISSQFLDLISKDKDARKKRDEQYEEGLRRTGLGDDAPGGAQFQGASKVVHPMLTEACVDFAARSIKELWPANGPVKDMVVGETDQKKVDKAKRKSALMNWQMTVQAQEARAELEQMLTQLPLGGAQYLKLGWDDRRNRPNFLAVMIDDMLLPYAATNFYSAQRKTHVQYITALDYQQRVKSGMYRDVDLTPPGLEPEASLAEQANNKIEGRTDTSYNEDGLRTVYEVYAITQIEEGEDASPYIITIDKPSGKILSIYRNWDEEDETREEMTWIVEFPFIPWRGAYPIGLPQMVGGLSAAATGALRALLDSAHIQNVPTMLKLKGGTRGGQTLNIQPTQVEEIEGGLNVDDVRKIAMPLPFNPPSPTLFQLLGFLVEAGKGVIRTSMEDLPDSQANAPVGTTLARIEQGMVVFNAIHSRLHDAMGRMLRVLHRLNEMYLDDERLEQEAGEELASRADFEGPMDVVPVSDPNIFSEAQRYAQVQAVAQRAQLLPQLYNQRKVEERILSTLKIPDFDALLNPAVEPEEQNAVDENVAAALGRPVVAFPEQDHIAHIKTHLGFMMNPMLGAGPMFQQTFMPGIINHLKEHVALWYMKNTMDLAESVADVDFDELGQQEHSDEDKRAFDRMLAEASMVVSEKAGAIFADLPPIIEQAQQMIQQFQQPPPMDPSQVAMQTAQQRMQIDTQKMQLEGQKAQQQMQLDQANMQMRQAETQQQMQLEQQKLMLQQQLAEINAQMDQAKAQQDLAALAMKEDREDARTAAELQARAAMNQADNQTAMTLAEMEMLSGEKIAVSTGTGINPQP
jgi:chaperonin GroES